MAALSIQPTFPIFTDTDGTPLENGYVWIGVENLDPSANPINVFWDKALTIPAAQPIRTIGGYPSKSGTPGRLYVNGSYSIRVLNKNASLVFSSPFPTETYSNLVLAEKYIHTVQTYADLFSTVATIGQQVCTRGHTQTGKGGAIYNVVSSASLISDGGTIAINGAIAFVMTNYERLTPENFGCLGHPADDTAAIKLFINAITNGAPAASSGIYNYSLLSGGQLNIHGSDLNWDATGTTIRCSQYPSAGASAQINFVDVEVEKINLCGLTVDGGWDYIANRVNGYCVANNNFNYMHGLTISAHAGFIDDITVHDCEGLGFTTESNAGIGKVQIGKITTRNNWMVGADIRGTSEYVIDLTIGEILAYENGTRGGGWVGVNFGDNKSAAGTQSITVGSIHSTANGGSGLGVGQYANPAIGDISGADTIVIGQIITNGNVGHGVEIYASKKIQIGSISASYNDKKGVYLERSDTNDLFGYVNSVNSIVSSYNGQEGVVVSGVNHIDIGGITSFNNGASGTGYSGVSLYAPSGLPATETGRASIKSIDTYDDQLIKTQDYGLNLVFYGQPTSYFHINSLNSYQNNLADVFYSTYGNCKPLFIDNARAANIYPRYADNSRVLFCVDGWMRQKWRTTNATPAATLIARPTPGFDCIVKIIVTGRTADGSTLHMGEDTTAYKWLGSGFQKQATLQSIVYKTGATDFYSQEFALAVAAYCVGIAATDILWDIEMWSSTGFDENFVI